ncbi:MAG: hypothetical protein O6945_15050 [Gammaproteobacteria bacterium]|nr:hypothetical protein [Gammaproteobacteria bacterium]
MKNLKGNFLIFILASSFLCVHAQADDESHSDDWQTPEALVSALYETVSIAPGEAADWDRFRALFADDAQLVMALDSTRLSGLLATDVEGLIKQSDAVYASTGFIENELAQHTVQFGNLASVYSTFEVRYKESDPAPLMRGLNHFQLLNDGERWYIISNSSVIENARWELPGELAVSIQKQ